MRHTFYYLSIISLVSLIAACSGGGSSSSRDPVVNSPSPAPATPVTEQYQGTWLAPAYGYGLQFGVDSAELFSYNSVDCILLNRFDDLSDAEIETAYRLNAGDLESFGDAGTADFSAPPVTYQRQVELPAACVSGFTPTIGDSDYVQSRARDLESFYQLFKQYSISLEVKNADWEAVYAAALTELREDMSDQAFVELLSDMIEPLADVHTSIVDGEAVYSYQNKPTHIFVYLDEYLNQNNLAPPLTAAQIDAANTYIGQQIERYEAGIFAYAEDDDDIQVSGNGNLIWFENGGLGYLNIANMFGFADAEFDDIAADLAALESDLDAIIAALQDTEGLIIDLRTNGGGRDVLSLAVASRFVSTDTHVYSKNAGLMDNETPLTQVTISPRGPVQYLNPVVVLVSPSTVSAAETLTLSLSALDHVTLIGSATQGAFSDVLQHQLANGLEVNLSNERYFAVSGEWYEGEGVPVDITVPVFALENREQGTDPAMAAAVSLLQQ